MLVGLAPCRDCAIAGGSGGKINMSWAFFSSYEHFASQHAQGVCLHTISVIYHVGMGSVGPLTVP